ncbi:MAG: membrane dipeptidase, partial [Bacillota bacterium]
AAQGGVIGIEAAPHTTITGDHPVHSIESYLEHFEYIRELVGIEHVAFGPDALYGDHVGLHDLFSSNMSIEEQTGTSRERIDYVKGLENPTEALDNIIRWLIKHGYSEKDMARVVSGNIIRVLEQAWV